MLLFIHHMPARSCTRPPYPKAMATTRFGPGNMASTKINQAQDESGQCGGTQAQRSGIGKFSILNPLVRPRLEFITESWETSGLVRLHLC